jgi:ATP-dependent DNA helicase RecG
VVGSEVEVKIYPDRLVIQNPGSLMPGLTTEDLKRDPHPSRKRNPLIAEVASYDYWIERAGTGTTRMIELCKKAGLPTPEFEDLSSGFSVTFRRDTLTMEMLATQGLSEREISAVLYVKEHGEITNSIYQERFGVSKRTASTDLSALAEQGILRKIGGSRGAGVRYVLPGS